MKRIYFKLIAASILFMPLFALFTSCSGDDYLNAIPGNSTALVSIDVQKYAEKEGSASAQAAITSFLGVDNISDCGIDVASRIYMFETADGNIGFAAKVKSSGDLTDWLSLQVKKGFCSEVKDYGGYSFTVLKDSWVAGYSSEALVVIGPVLPSAQAVVRRQVAQYLAQDEDEGIQASPMMAYLDSIQAPVALVAQVSALPEKFVAPFMLGAPKDVDGSKVMLAAGLSSGMKGCIVIRGTTFSPDKRVDAELRRSREVFRPIAGDYLNSMSPSSAIGVFANVEGGHFIRLLHSNKTFQALLAGMNMAVDMDNIIKSVDGDMAMIVENTGGSNIGLFMLAKLGSTAFMEDIDYWKQSCPAGTSISDLGDGAYRYSGGDMDFTFGVKDNQRFYASTFPGVDRLSSVQSGWSLPSAADSLVMGRRMAVVANVSALSAIVGPAGSYLKALAGGVQTIVFIME